MRKDWEVKKLGDICEIQNGFAFKSTLFREQGLPILRISNIQNDVITLDNIVYFSKSDYNTDLDRFKVYPEDIVIALSGATTGKIGINRTDLTFYLNQRVALCRESDVLIKEYLFYYLRTKTIELLSMAGGAAQPNLSTNQIQQLLILLPSLKTQQQIVEELNCLTSIIEKQKKQLEELENLAQAIFYDMFGDPIENEKRWETCKVINVIKMKRGFDLPIQNRNTNGKIPIYGSNGIIGYHNESKINYGIITGRSGTLGEVYDCNKPFWPLNTTLFSVDTHGNNIIYLKFLMKFFHLERFKSGAGVPTLNRNDFHNKNIPNIPIEHQQQFASNIKAIEKQKELIKKSIKETEDLFNSRMDYYFN